MKNENTLRARSIEKLTDHQLRGNFKRAMDGLMAKRADQFSNASYWNDLVNEGQTIRSQSVREMPDLLVQLEKKCLQNGISVHWAETAADAQTIVLDILKATNSKKVIKGKSMVTEEIHLNSALEKSGIEVLETDLGEYIIQLDNEPPSHIIMPAIHKNKAEIANTLNQAIGNGSTSQDVDVLTTMARHALRTKFIEADAGITGVNFAVAQTGTLCLVENEGNGRMSSTLPPVHIAVTGIDKVVASLSDLPPLLSLLTKSATGQPITTYVNMITSPKKNDELDGPNEVHLVLLDNGRSRVRSSPVLRDTLRCIRCAACMNHCPVYTRIGGHAYGTVYPGPIGKILMPQLEGLDKYGDLTSASTLCGACVEVCPVRIPITDILANLRQQSVRAEENKLVQGSSQRRKFHEAMIWRIWCWLNTSPRIYSIFLIIFPRIYALLPSKSPGLKNWTHVRQKPKIANRSLHQMLKKRGRNYE